VGARVTAAPSPPFGRQRWIPANAGIQRFSQFCSVALDARVRGHDTQGAWIARTGQASLAVKRRMWAWSLGQHPERWRGGRQLISSPMRMVICGVVALLILVARLLELGARGPPGRGLALS
jgi:hypothetical protein